MAKVLDLFALSRPYIGWAELLVGLVVFLLTAVGVIPSFGQGIVARVASCAGWLVLAQEGYGLLVDESDA